MSLEILDKSVVLIIWMNALTAIFITFTFAVCLEASSRRGLSLKISFPDLYSEVHQAPLCEASKQIIAVFISMLLGLLLESEFPMKEVKQLPEF